MSLPDRGDVVWLDFYPQAGHEPAGRRPAVVLSSKSYNARSGMALFCPVTSRRKDYPFEVPIPEGLPIQGVVLADQVKSLDWRVRKPRIGGRVSEDFIREVVAKLRTLLDPGA